MIKRDIKQLKIERVLSTYTSNKELEYNIQAAWDLKIEKAKNRVNYFGRGKMQRWEGYRDGRIFTLITQYSKAVCAQ